MKFEWATNSLDTMMVSLKNPAVTVTKSVFSFVNEVMLLSAKSRSERSVAVSEPDKMSAEKSERSFFCKVIFGIRFFGCNIIIILNFF